MRDDGVVSNMKGDDSREIIICERRWGSVQQI